jgi:hypothetical protein
MPTSAIRMQILHRRMEEARCYIEGMPQHEIAVRFNIGQSLVSRDLMWVRERWLENLLEGFDAKKAQELARLDHLEAEAWDAWKRSRQVREVTIAETMEGGEFLGPDGRPLSMTPRRVARVRREVQVGDPRFMDVVDRCIDKRCKILGLYAAKRVRVDWDNLTDRQLERLAAGEPFVEVMADA